MSDAGSTTSRTDRRRALARRPRSPSTDSDFSSRSSRSARGHRRRYRSRSSFSSDRESARSRDGTADAGAKEKRKRDKIPYGFLAGIGVSAYLLHKYWPKGWVHGDHGYWDKVGKDGSGSKRGAVEEVVRDGRERAEARVRDKGEHFIERARPAYEGFKDGYVRERDGQQRQQEQQDRKSVV